MTELTLNGAEWKTRDDVYDSFFRAVGATDWHGRNFNALRDSIATGSINTVEVRYRRDPELRQDRPIDKSPFHSSHLETGLF